MTALEEKTYPVFISLSHCHITLAGYGNVGARKLKGLLEGGAQSILVLDIKSLSAIPQNHLEALQNPFVTFEKRSCSIDDVKKSTLVFAATNNHAENTRIAQICQKEHTLCNCITTPAEGSFMVPAVARSGILSAAISTGGTSPALAGFLGREMRKWLRNKTRLAWLLARLRPLLLSGRYDYRQDIFKKIFASSFTYWLDQHELDKCYNWLIQTFPGLPKDSLDIIFLEYANVFP